MKCDKRLVWRMKNLPKAAKSSFNVQGLVLEYESACRLSKDSPFWENRARYLSCALNSIANEHGVPYPRKKLPE